MVRKRKSGSIKLPYKKSPSAAIATKYLDVDETPVRLADEEWWIEVDVNSNHCRLMTNDCRVLKNDQNKVPYAIQSFSREKPLNHNRSTYIGVTLCYKNGKSTKSPSLKKWGFKKNKFNAGWSSEPFKKFSLLGGTAAEDSFIVQSNKTISNIEVAEGIVKELQEISPHLYSRSNSPDSDSAESTHPAVTPSPKASSRETQDPKQASKKHKTDDAKSCAMQPSTSAASKKHKTDDSLPPITVKLASTGATCNVTSVADEGYNGDDEHTTSTPIDPVKVKTGNSKKPLNKTSGKTCNSGDEGEFAIDPVKVKAGNSKKPLNKTSGKKCNSGDEGEFGNQKDVIDPVNVKVKIVNAKKPVNKMKKSCHDESGDELGSQKDVFHLYGYPDCISDFSDSEDMKKESVLKAIGKKKDFLRRNRKTVLHNDENRKFQDRMRKHTIGQYQVHVNYLKSAHDSERKALVDRPLDDAHVQYIKENAREYPRLGMVSGTWLGLYNGTAQEFSDQDKEISKKNARRLRDRAQNKGTSKDPITMLDPVSGADVQDTLTVIGGNHRLAAFTQLAEEHQNNEQEIIERFTSGVLRIIIVVIVTKYVNPHDPSDVDILDDNDVSKLAREHNCNPRELSKVFFDRVMSLRRAALSQANMPNVDLSISLPPTWTRRDTDIAFKEFCSKEFRQGKSDPAAQQLSKAKHLVEQPGTYFQDLKHMHEECRRISGLYFKQNEKTLADGEKIGMEFNLITVANVGRPLAPLATRTQHKLISQLRVKLDALVKTIDDNEFGVKPQLMALIDAFKKKCEKERRRQIFMYGLSVATGVAASKLIETFGSFITDDSNYAKYLPDLESFKSKKPAVKELPPSFQNFYTQMRAIINAQKPKHPMVAAAAEAKEIQENLVRPNKETGSKIVRQADAGVVVLLGEFDTSEACSRKPRDISYVGVSTTIVFNLSQRTDAAEFLDAIHGNMSSNQNVYTIICLGDTVDDLAAITAKYNFEQYRLLVDKKKPRPSKDRFGFYDQFDHVTLLCMIRKRKNMDKSSNACTPISQYFQGRYLWSPSFHKEIIELVTPKDGWVLDCASSFSPIGDLFFVSKALVFSPSYLGVFVKVDESKLTDDSIDSYADLLFEHIKKVQLDNYKAFKENGDAVDGDDDESSGKCVNVDSLEDCVAVTPPKVVEDPKAVEEKKRSMTLATLRLHKLWHHIHSIQKRICKAKRKAVRRKNSQIKRRSKGQILENDNGDASCTDLGSSAFTTSAFCSLESSLNTTENNGDGGSDCHPRVGITSDLPSDITKSKALVSTAFISIVRAMTEVADINNGVAWNRPSPESSYHSDVIQKTPSPICPKRFSSSVCSSVGRSAYVAHPADGKKTPGKSEVDLVCEKPITAESGKISFAVPKTSKPVQVPLFPNAEHVGRTGGGEGEHAEQNDQTGEVNENNEMETSEFFEPPKVLVVPNTEHNDQTDEVVEKESSEVSPDLAKVLVTNTEQSDQTGEVDDVDEKETCASQSPTLLEVLVTNTEQSDQTGKVDDVDEKETCASQSPTLLEVANTEQNVQTGEVNVVVKKETSEVSESDLAKVLVTNTEQSDQTGKVDDVDEKETCASQSPTLLEVLVTNTEQSDQTGKVDDVDEKETCASQSPTLLEVANTEQNVQTGEVNVVVKKETSEVSESDLAKVLVTNTEQSDQTGKVDDVDEKETCASQSPTLLEVLVTNTEQSDQTGEVDDVDEKETCASQSPTLLEVANTEQNVQTGKVDVVDEKETSEVSESDLAKVLVTNTEQNDQTGKVDDADEKETCASQSPTLLEVLVTNADENEQSGKVTAAGENGTSKVSESSNLAKQPVLNSDNEDPTVEANQDDLRDNNEKSEVTESSESAQVSVLPNEEQNAQTSEVVQIDELDSEVSEVPTPQKLLQNTSPSPEVLEQLTIQRDMPPFSPVTSNWQTNKSNMLNIRKPKGLSYASRGAQILGSEPAKTLDVSGDGNCLFRCVSMVLKGTQKEHISLRMTCCRFLAVNYEFYKNRHDLKETAKEYSNRMMRSSSNALDKKKWGTDLEISIFSDLLQTDIYTFVTDYHGYGWQRFQPNNREKYNLQLYASLIWSKQSTKYQAIYLLNDNSHYQVVTSIRQIKPVGTEPSMDRLFPQTTEAVTPAKKTPAKKRRTTEENYENKSPVEATIGTPPPKRRRIGTDAEGNGETKSPLKTANYCPEAEGDIEFLSTVTGDVFDSE